MSLELELEDTDRDTRRPCGFIADEPGHPYDGPAGELLGASVPLPLAYEQPTGPVLDQAHEDCVANAFADAIRDRQAMQGVERPRLPARKWIYWNARRLAGRERFDEGSQPSLAIRAIRELGMPSEEFCPYVDAAGEPELLAGQHAYDQRGLVSARALDPEDIRHALARDLAVVIAVNVDQRLQRLAPDAGPWTFAGPLVGRHALRVVAYDHGLGLRLKNSWSPRWCEDGFGWMHWEGLVDDTTTQGLWVVEWAPSFSEDVPAEIRS